MNVQKNLFFRLFATVALLSFAVACQKDPLPVLESPPFREPVFADFTYALREDSLIFTSSSTGRILEHQWQITGDGEFTLLYPNTRRVVFIIPDEVTEATLNLTVWSSTDTSTRSKDIDTILRSLWKPVADFTHVLTTDSLVLNSTSTGKIVEYQWEIVGDQGLTILHPTSKRAILMIPSGVAVPVRIRLTVRNATDSSSHSGLIDLDLSTRYQRWGLGNNLTESVSNNVSYEWYINQRNTGLHSSANCGPTSATMAIKWADSTFTGTVEDARNTYQPGGGGWAANTMMTYLSRHSISNSWVGLPNENALKSQIDSGRIVILALDMHYIRQHKGNPEWRTDRHGYYPSPGSGHYVIAKGYRVVDDILWIEIYDPGAGYWNDDRYADGTRVGRDRYYRSEDIMQAKNVWWRQWRYSHIDVPNMITVRRR
jgi:hypothetical protein